MSQTLSVDVVGPSYWTYMATVMADCLERISQAGRIETSAVPPGVFKDALAFWQLALQATSGAVPDNLPALNAYVIAFETLRWSLPASPTREDIDKELVRYDAFLKTLGTPRALDVEDTQIVGALKSFFVHLKEEGECEAYTQTVQLETVPTGSPFRGQ
jgi:hypothetical protein